MRRNALQQSGTLRLGRGEIAVHDRTTLREMSCDCYRRMERASHR